MFYSWYCTVQVKIIQIIFRPKNRSTNFNSELRWHQSKINKLKKTKTKTMRCLTRWRNLPKIVFATTKSQRAAFTLHSVKLLPLLKWMQFFEQMMLHIKSSTSKCWIKLASLQRVIPLKLQNQSDQPSPLSLAWKSPFLSEDAILSIFQQPRQGGRLFFLISHCHRLSLPSDEIVFITWVAIQPSSPPTLLISVSISQDCPFIATP